MAEGDEELASDGLDTSWKERSLEEHGRALADLLLYVSAAARRSKPDELDFPVIKELMARRHK